MRAHRFLGWGSIALAVGIIANAALGPLLLGVMVHRATPEITSQVVGGDLAALVLIAPFSLVAGVLALRRHPAAALCVMGPAAYAAYTSMQLVVGQEHLDIAGNVERFFPLHLALFVLGTALVVVAWASTNELPALDRRRRRAAAGLLLGMSAFLTVGLHLPGLVDAWRDTPQAAEYLAGPTAFWVVKMMDLGIVVPTAVAVAVGLLRSAAWARRPVYVVASWFTFLAASVAGMAIVMLAESRPGATLANVVAFTCFTVITAAMTWRLYRPLFLEGHRVPFDHGRSATGPAVDQAGHRLRA